MIEDILERYKELYPDEMVLKPMDEFERVKLIGKVEMLKEIEEFILEEYGTKLTASS